jgi:hypothetical protein
MRDQNLDNDYHIVKEKLQGEIMKYYTTKKLQISDGI